MATELLDAPLAPLTSTLPDLRGVPLALLGDDGADEALRRLLPGAEVQPVPVASFQSSL
jgi:FXSXX-COOH protein